MLELVGKSSYSFTHNPLGNALKDKGLLDEAIREYYETLRHQGRGESIKILLKLPFQ